MRAKAILACKGDDDEELSFANGEILLNVVKSDEPGWLYGTIESTKKRGLFPQNYVEFMEDEDLLKEETKLEMPVKSILKQYSGTNPNLLTKTEDNSYKLLSKLKSELILEESKSKPGNSVNEFEKVKLKPVGVSTKTISSKKLDTSTNLSDAWILRAESNTIPVDTEISNLVTDKTAKKSTQATKPLFEKKIKNKSVVENDEIPQKPMVSKTSPTFEYNENTKPKPVPNPATKPTVAKPVVGSKYISKGSVNEVSKAFTSRGSMDNKTNNEYLNQTSPSQPLKKSAPPAPPKEKKPSIVKKEIDFVSADDKNGSPTANRLLNQKTPAAKPVPPQPSSKPVPINVKPQKISALSNNETTNGNKGGYIPLEKPKPLIPTTVSLEHTPQKETSKTRDFVPRPSHTKSLQESGDNTMITPFSEKDLDIFTKQYLDKQNSRNNKISDSNNIIKKGDNATPPKLPSRNGTDKSIGSVTSSNMSTSGSSIAEIRTVPRLLKLTQERCVRYSHLFNRLDKGKSRNSTMANTENTKRKYTAQEWEKKLNDNNISKKDMNRLIMEYLIIEGYKDAAENFSAEADIQSSVDLSTIEDRMIIRSNIQNGLIKDAIEQVNEVNPELLETDPHLYFKLKQQELIELIRCGKITEALEFAQEELAAKGEEFPELLPELENTMALFACDLDEEIPSEISSLLDYKHRQAVASELNSAILSSQSQPNESRLLSLLYLLCWVQDKLSKEAEFPRITNVFNAEMSGPEMEEN
ncbi:hypothetical protein BB559_000351 [Furculomyces boomerangus]|uniref:SH3 domain-containing protein n=2 Tax=Harpellales TaxID=61421 RepID=A0A2T9Z5H3_9FUNG|nr:hypothetical protein BB559_000351 [Furculomyces boomerangus]PWA01652.1 hypothetical protein BB558_002226 [Smittium angustum]